MNDQPTAAVDRTMVDVSLLLVRIIVGVIFAAHGAQKLLGWFDGPGLAATVEKMGGGILPYLVTTGEFFGGLGLVVGFLTRFSASSLVVIMIGAIALVHGPKGFFQSNGGFEYNLALIGLLVPLVLCGPGRYSIGRMFMPRSRRTGRPYLAIE